MGDLTVIDNYDFFKLTKYYKEMEKERLDQLTQDREFSISLAQSVLTSLVKFLANSLNSIFGKKK